MTVGSGLMVLNDDIMNIDKKKKSYINQDNQYLIIQNIFQTWAFCNIQKFSYIVSFKKFNIAYYSTLTFKKLVLVLIFAAISLDAKPHSKRLFRKATANEDYEVGKIYYSSNVIDNDGYLTLDLDVLSDEEYDLNITLSNHKVLVDGKTKDDSSFSIIPEAGFSDLKANKFPTAELGCEFIEDDFIYGTYTHLGLVLNALTGEDIAPSIAWLYKKGPKGVRFTHIPAGEEEDYEDVPLEFTCDEYMIDPISLSLQKYGVTDSVCIPNSAIPASVDKCKDGSAIKVRMVGYRVGYFEGDADTIKEALLRYGPIFTYSNVIVGWETVGSKQNWLSAENPDYGKSQFTLGREEISEWNSWGGLVYFNPDPNADPSATDVPSTQVDCSKITKETSKDDCPCPLKTDKDAWKADPRTEKKGDICESGSIRMTLSVIAAAVVLPVLALFI
ncbi:MAG: hypothetical protein EZS28_006256 [Streblomastix strix]|uniref:Uncharacterized protein n=1 Tax=Streblomastix strix TaxID=222440 RepID=A0A5J4WVJ0_9EUKA|nr:MAG: hypothetical protein EZS28_006256 [Streblomastix strix]